MHMLCKGVAAEAGSRGVGASASGGEESTAATAGLRLRRRARRLPLPLRALLAAHLEGDAPARAARATAALGVGRLLLLEHLHGVRAARALARRLGMVVVARRLGLVLG